jgi:hypothetical protein
MLLLITAAARPRQHSDSHVRVPGWTSYTPMHWVPFSSPPTTRRATAEVFDPPPHGIKFLTLSVTSSGITSAIIHMPTWDPIRDYSPKATIFEVRTRESQIGLQDLWPLITLHIKLIYFSQTVTRLAFMSTRMAFGSSDLQ